MSSFTLYNLSMRPLWLFWGWLLLLMLAEVLIFLVNPSSGLILHALILSTLVAYAAVGEGDEQRNLALGLTLAPLIRLLSIAMPLSSFPQLVSYPIVAVPVLIAVGIVVRQVRLSRLELGLHAGGLFLQLMLVGMGIGFGVIEYFILQPASLISPSSGSVFWLAVLNLVIFTGFTEELIFRGLLQRLALSVLGRYGVIYISLLFAILHIGYRSIPDLIFVFVVGLLFAYAAFWGNSILGVTLAHGMTNVMLFLVMPYVVQNSSVDVRAITATMTIVGSLLSGVALMVLIWHAGRTGRLIPSGFHPVPVGTFVDSSAKLKHRQSHEQRRARIYVASPQRLPSELEGDVGVTPGPSLLSPMLRQQHGRQARSGHLIRIGLFVGLTLVLWHMISIVMRNTGTIHIWDTPATNRILEWTLAIFLCQVLGGAGVQILEPYTRFLVRENLHVSRTQWGWTSRMRAVGIILLAGAAALGITPLVAPTWWTGNELLDILKRSGFVLLFMAIGAAYLKMCIGLISVVLPRVSGAILARALLITQMALVAVGILAFGVMALLHS